jgi:hypothetical protein
MKLPTKRPISYGSSERFRVVNMEMSSIVGSHSVSDDYNSVGLQLLDGLLDGGLKRFP